MKLCLAACAATVLLATGASAASAATMTPSPAKKCYRDGEIVQLGGSGFPANSDVSISRDGMVFARAASTSPGGEFLGQSHAAAGHGADKAPVHRHGRDQSRPVTASISLVVSAIEVKVRPDTGTPGEAAAHRRPRIHHGKDALRAHRAQGEVAERAHRPPERRLLQAGGPQAPVLQEDEGRHLPRAVRHQAPLRPGLPSAVRLHRRHLASTASVVQPLAATVITPRTGRRSRR